MAQSAVVLCSLVALWCLPLPAQQGGTNPPVAPTPPAKGDQLRRAMVEAEAGRSAISAAADEVLNSGTAARTKFAATVRAIAAVAPKPEPKPESTPPAKSDASPAPASGGATETAKIELPDATKTLMNDVVTGNDEASKSALGKLAADAESGTKALARLDERGRAVLQRCLVLTLRRKMDTNAIFAGQYDELKDFQPEAGELLLKWAIAAPQGVARADDFRVASLRAVRDVVAADKADDTMRATLREIAGKAQQAGNQNLFIAAACALHQYGDPAIFDQVKAAVEKNVASEKEEERIGAANMLAELHYQLREYETAATHYKTAVDLLEKQPTPPQNMPTMLYNAACSLSLAKKTDEALQYLDKALQAGAKSRALSKAMVDADHDMNNLRADPRFAELMERYFGKAAGAAK